MQVDPRQEIEIGLLPQEVDIVLHALAQRPYCDVAALIHKINARIIASLKPASPANDIDGNPEPQG